MRTRGAAAHSLERHLEKIRQRMGSSQGKRFGLCPPPPRAIEVEGARAQAACSQPAAPDVRFRSIGFRLTVVAEVTLLT